MTTRSKINTRTNSHKKILELTLERDKKLEKKKKEKKNTHIRNFFIHIANFTMLQNTCMTNIIPFPGAFFEENCPPDFTSFQSTDITNVKLFQNLEIVPQKNFCPSLVHAEIKVYLLTPSPLLTPPLMNCHSFISKPAVNG